MISAEFGSHHMSNFVTSRMPGRHEYGAGASQEGGRHWLHNDALT